MQQRPSDKVLIRRLAIILVLTIVGGWTCNEHGLNPFRSSIEVGVIEQTPPPNRRPVDIIFMVDGSFSMCEEQAVLTENFNRFIETLVNEGADFRLAVVNDEMVESRFPQSSEPDFQLLKGGVFQTNIGPYQDNIAVCSSDQGIAFISSITSSGGIREQCNARTDLPSDGVINSSNYENLFAIENPTAQREAITQLQTDFSCLALTGIDSSGLEMGIDKVRQTLFNQRGDNDEIIRNNNGESQTFLRRNLRDPDRSAFLSIVFVTDENDCSDFSGTDIPGDSVMINNPNQLGVVAEAALDGEGTDDDVCEFRRNVEDSCLRSVRNFQPITLNVPTGAVDEAGMPVLDEMGNPETQPVTKRALDWCIEGDRDFLATIPNLFQAECPPIPEDMGDAEMMTMIDPCIEVDCPLNMDGQPECANELTPRKRLFDLITAQPDTCNPDNLAADGCEDPNAECLRFEAVEGDTPNARLGLCSGFTGLGYRPEDVILATIINRDNQGGTRPDESDKVGTPPNDSLPAFCGAFGNIGYRYNLLAEMFPQERRVIAPICNQGTIPSELPGYCGILPEDRGVAPDEATRNRRCPCLDGTVDQPDQPTPERPIDLNCNRDDAREQCAANDFCGGARPNIGDPLNFASELENIADTIGRAINNVCLVGSPAECVTDDDCPSGQRCGCTPEEAESNAECRGYIFQRSVNPESEFSEQEYRICSGFQVLVDFTINDVTERLTQGEDFTVDFQAQDLCDPSPLRINFERAPNDQTQIQISYPQAISLDAD